MHKNSVKSSECHWNAFVPKGVLATAFNWRIYTFFSLLELCLWWCTLQSILLWHDALKPMPSLTWMRRWSRHVTKGERSDASLALPRFLNPYFASSLQSFSKDDPWKESLLKVTYILLGLSQVCGGQIVAEKETSLVRDLQQQPWGGDTTT